MRANIALFVVLLGSLMLFTTTARLIRRHTLVARRLDDIDNQNEIELHQSGLTNDDNSDDINDDGSSFTNNRKLAGLFGRLISTRKLSDDGLDCLDCMITDYDNPIVDDSENSHDRNALPIRKRHRKH